MSKEKTQNIMSLTSGAKPSMWSFSFCKTERDTKRGKQLFVIFIFFISASKNSYAGIIQSLIINSHDIIIDKMKYRTFTLSI